MKAVAVFPGKQHSSHLTDMGAPDLAPSEVLVKVLRVGVDGTDHEIDDGLYGEAPEGYSYLIIGHEALGVVEDIGLDVVGFAQGELVVPAVRRPCPENCLNCGNEQFDFCLTGNYKERGIRALHGYMSEYFGEKPQYLVKIPSQFEEIGFLLGPLSVVEKAISQIFKIQQRMMWEPKKALVLGAGPIGILATLKLRSKGIETYIGATRSKESIKAQLVEATGASYMSMKDRSIDEYTQEMGNLDIIPNIAIAFSTMLVILALCCVSRHFFMLDVHQVRLCKKAPSSLPKVKIPTPIT